MKPAGAHSHEVQDWWSEFEKLALFLSRIGPDDVCCGDLTPRQCEVLRVLNVGEGTRLSDLAAATGITASAMTRALERLEKQGLVRRVHGEMRDGRATTVELTHEGDDACCQFDNYMKQRTITVLSAIPESERKEILQSLRKLNKAFGKAGCCGSDPVSALKKCRRADVAICPT